MSDCECPYKKPCGKKPCDDGGTCPKDKYPIIDPWPYQPYIVPYQPYWPQPLPTGPIWVSPVYTTCTTGAPGGQ